MADHLRIFSLEKDKTGHIYVTVQNFELHNQKKMYSKSNILLPSSV